MKLATKTDDIVQAIDKAEDILEGATKGSKGFANTEEFGTLKGNKGVEGTELRNSAETQASVNKKLETYLLDKTHVTGGSKAKWFDEALGFNQTNMESLSKQIVFDPETAIQTNITKYGPQYNQIIRITGANGKVIDVTFAWIKNEDGIVRLVTAVPTKK